MLSNPAVSANPFYQNHSPRSVWATLPVQTDRLPVEITHIILDYLLMAERPDEIPIIPLSSINALRTTCRFFAGLAPSYFYKCVWLFSDEDSFARLTALTNHQIYRYMVRSIKFLPKLLLGGLRVRNEYDKRVKDIEYPDARGEQWRF